MTPDRSPPRRRDGALGRVLTGALAAASVLVVLVLWTAAGGPAALLTEGTAILAAARLTGLVAADLLLLQVLAMARVPWLEHAWGQDRLARGHRLLGFTSFWLMAGHVVLVGYGYAAPAAPGCSPSSPTWSCATRACCSPQRAPRCWCWWWDCRCGRRGGGCATRTGTCCTCTRTSASGWPCRTSCGTARTSSPRPRRRCTGGRCGVPRSPRCWCSGSGGRCG
ncbi:ferric reductase-like transmembrane domain-containing protein [Catellatospora bangladeshensis]|uniref:ferric reductase-like transmembrane domain-containing protein n=1 Tax=Catellatospora bangladeshensis TaxID=310355 RepID=UPI00361A9369